MKILSVSTSLSEDSTTLKLAEKILTATASAGESRGIDVEVDRINVRTLTTSLTDMTLTGFRSEELERAFAKVAEADVIITVTPVYKVAPVGLHSLFWQLIDEKALTGKSVLIASTGGTPRHSMAAETALRPMLSYLKGIVAPTSVFAATEDWGSAEGGRNLSSRIAQAAEEVLDLTVAIGGFAEVNAEVGVNGSASRSISSPRRSSGVDDEFNPELITPFAQLLQG